MKFNKKPLQIENKRAKNFVIVFFIMFFNLE